MGLLKRIMPLNRIRPLNAHQEISENTTSLKGIETFTPNNHLNHCFTTRSTHQNQPGRVVFLLVLASGSSSDTNQTFCGLCVFLEIV